MGKQNVLSFPVKTLKPEMNWEKLVDKKIRNKTECIDAVILSATRKKSPESKLADKDGFVTLYAVIIIDDHNAGAGNMASMNLLTKDIIDCYWEIAE